MIKYEDLVHFDDIPKDRYSDSQISDELEHDNRREHKRFSLRPNPSASLVLACDGVAVTLFEPGWLTAKSLGAASIKDFSLSGVGLLASMNLVIGQQLYIQFEQQRLLCEITRTHQVQGRLRFWGARWVEADNMQLLSLLQQLKRRSVN
ncbi:PilZ domain-containing protein [Shewanella algidipiscicola]|uniref:PilZ domain-containing protein n=1 Tax=Shewanella algidipiscicola TaxID=614070 RepID=A0ABQ4P283_9GAMM|nr:PilZ domain-containing protein [Shewanella algidipiscicola]GIU41548.1 hypothetical protein TUM4630_00410 [Shewanella algidipiscicola]